MIFGTGIDIIEVDRIKNSIQKYLSLKRKNQNNLLLFF